MHNIARGSALIATYIASLYRKLKLFAMLQLIGLNIAKFSQIETSVAREHLYILY